jgi:hypothetical protein
MIAKGVDYAVSAAVQEIDVAASVEGLAGAFNDDTGHDPQYLKTYIKL